MSLKIGPPFKISPRLSEGLILDPDEISLKRLRDVVTGRDTTFSRSRAMALLLASDFPNKHRDFEVVLENETESSTIRYVAAINLGRMNTPAAAEILIRNSHVRDERVLSGVMKALGRIGDKTALDAIFSAQEYAEGLAASQAKFAATLIAHRLGLEEGDSPIPKTGDHLEVHPSARPFPITRAGDTDAEFCLRSLADQPFGIEFSEHPMYQARCGRNTWMILLNRELVGKYTVQQLKKQKAFLGVVAIRNEETRLYSVAFLLLTSPAKEKDAANILIYRTTGELVFSGTARVEGNCAAFSILALPRPGAFAVQIEGSFEDGRLDINTALSTEFVQMKKREPSEELTYQG
jgi:hypothetical protein